MTNRIGRSGRLHDDEIVGGIDVDILVEQAQCRIGVALREGPPLVLVAQLFLRPGRLVALGRHGGFLHPVSRNNLLAVGLAFIQEHQAKTGMIAGGGGKACAEELAANGRRPVHDPVGVICHAGRLPELFGHILGAGLADGLFEDAAEHAGVERGVVEGPLRRIGARLGFLGGIVAPAVLVANEGIVMNGGQLGVAAEFIDLQPVHAGAHLQQIADGRPVIAAALHLGQIVGHLVVEALDMAIGQRKADQRRDIGLGDREGQKAGVLVAAIAVGLVNEVAVLQHDQRIGVGRLKRTFQIQFGLSNRVLALQRDRHGRQRLHLRPCGNGPGREHLVHVLERQVVQRRVQHVGAGIHHGR